MDRFYKTAALGYAALSLFPRFQPGASVKEELSNGPIGYLQTCAVTTLSPSRKSLPYSVKEVAATRRQHIDGRSDIKKNSVFVPSTRDLKLSRPSRGVTEKKKKKALLKQRLHKKHRKLLRGRKRKRTKGLNEPAAMDPMMMMALMKSSNQRKGKEEEVSIETPVGKGSTAAVPITEDDFQWAATTRPPVLMTAEQFTSSTSLRLPRRGTNSKPSHVMKSVTEMKETLPNPPQTYPDFNKELERHLSLAKSDGEIVTSSDYLQKKESFLAEQKLIYDRDALPSVCNLIARYFSEWTVLESEVRAFVDAKPPIERAKFLAGVMRLINAHSNKTTWSPAAYLPDLARISLQSLYDYSVRLETEFTDPTRFLDFQTLALLTTPELERIAAPSKQSEIAALIALFVSRSFVNALSREDTNDEARQLRDVYRMMFSGAKVVNAFYSINYRLRELLAGNALKKMEFKRDERKQGSIVSPLTDLLGNLSTDVCALFEAAFGALTNQVTVYRPQFELQKATNGRFFNALECFAGCGATAIAPVDGLSNVGNMPVDTYMRYLESFRCSSDGCKLSHFTTLLRAAGEVVVEDPDWFQESRNVLRPRYRGVLSKRRKPKMLCFARTPAEFGWTQNLQFADSCTFFGQEYRLAAIATGDGQILYRTPATSPNDSRTSMWKIAIPDLEGRDGYRFLPLTQEASEKKFEDLAPTTALAVYDSSSAIQVSPEPIVIATPDRTLEKALVANTTI